MESLWIGHKVRLRAYTADDLAAFQPYYDDSEMERLAFDVRFPRDLARVRKQLEKEIDQDVDDFDDHWLVIETLDEGRPVGNVGLSHASARHRTADIGISIFDRAAWGKGYASEAMRLLLRFAFRELDYAKINLSVMADNPRAVALYERLGFQHEGCRRAQYYGAGRRWDELFMGLTRAEYEAQHASWFPEDGR
jgi:RimJ/RimL family protein N-acetyltransferase